MTNHVHLLITPCYADSVSRIIQHVGRQYVQYINKTYKRSGTLWEGRHKSSLVDAEHYLLLCYRYIELNPVTANMVQSPEQYPWSSYRSNALGETDELVSEHASFAALANTQADKHLRYRALFNVALPDHDVHQLREGLKKNFPLGNNRFKAQVESALNRKIGTGNRGRPRLDSV